MSQLFAFSIQLQRICFAFLVCLILALTLHANADAVDDYIEHRMLREHIPGLSLVVMKDGKILKAKGYGHASLELNVPTSTATVYELASTTKPFVAAAIMLLVQDGKLSLDDKITAYLKDTPEAWKAITIRQLLSHTSGIKDYANELRHDFPSDTPPDQIIKAAMDAPLNFQPGSQWAYSNTGYVILGVIAARVSGQTYDEFLQERVFKPLGMQDTRRDSSDGVFKNRATGYLWVGGEYHNAEFLKYMMTNYGDRGLLSTVMDLAKWDSALSSNRILSKAATALMWSPVIKFDGGGTYEFGYGLGWFIKEVNGHRQISHPGGAPGAGAILSRYPDDGLTVIMLVNGGKAFMQALDLGVAQHYIPGLAKAVPARVSTRLLDSYTGYYNAYGSQILTALRYKSCLYLDDGGGLNNDFIPVSDTRFVAEEADRAFTVVPDAKLADAILQLGKDKMSVQRIGPLARGVVPQPDPDPMLTHQIQDILISFAHGGEAVERVALLAPQARKDFSHGPANELAGVGSISYICEQKVSGRGIQRHGMEVSRVIYYRLLTPGAAKYVLIYLTPGNLVTDEDVVSD